MSSIKRSHKGISRLSIAGVAEKCSKKFSALAMFCWFLLDVVVAVKVVISKSQYITKYHSWKTLTFL